MNVPVNDIAYFCPECGSAKITASTLAGGAASCGVCTWQGSTTDLLTYTFQHALGSQDEIVRQFLLDARTVISKSFAIQIGSLLVRWGFVDDPTPSNVKAVNKQLARYVGAIATAVVKAVFETRGKVEKERRREPS